MYRRFHLWRLQLHLSQGNADMALDALWSEDDVFSWIDALILASWIAGARDRREAIHGKPDSRPEGSP